MKRDKEAIFTVQPVAGHLLMYGAEDLAEDLTELYDFIVNEMAVELSEDSTIKAKELATKLMPLDYIINYVEFRENRQPFRSDTAKL